MYREGEGNRRGDVCAGEKGLGWVRSEIESNTHMATSMKLRQIGVMAILWLGLGVFARAEGGLNDAFGISLWSSPSLWQDSAPTTARRLGISGNENTGNAHYKGPLDEKEKVLGVRAYSVEIYANNDKIDKVSIGFVNRADLYNELARKQIEDKKGPNKSPVRVKSRKEVEIKKEDVDEAALFLELEKRMAAEKDPAFAMIVANLTQRIGRPESDEAEVKKWLWSGHRLIAEKSASAVTLKIEQVQAARATANTTPAQQVQQVTAKMANSVDRRSNGDVVIGGIPPISQGDRGFCVPATWEKVLRYYGLNVDVYQLADKGGTDVGGSMFIPFAAKMAAMLEKQNYALEFLDKGAPDLMKIKSYVDKGVPLIWGMDARDMREWVDRSEKRSSKLPQAKAPVPPAPGAKEEVAGHCLMVIGYNAGFQELALSDSTELGSGKKEIWISVADAAKADLKQGLIAVVPRLGATGGAVTGQTGAGGTPPASSAPPSGKKWY